MVRAILDGRKTETRRAMKPQPEDLPDGAYCDPYNHNYDHFTFWTSDNRMILGCGGNIPNTAHWRCPYGVPGDRLWVREGFRMAHINGVLKSGDFMTIQFREGFGVLPYDTEWRKRYSGLADREMISGKWTASQTGNFFGKWRPSIHMPRWASRITLEITCVLVEQVQDISEGDAKAEGCNDIPYMLPGESDLRLGPFSITRPRFRRLWDSINAKRGYGWDANPWVWVIGFKRG
jgi:hypothetical protein